MYTEGIKIGDNSYILSGDDGTLRVLHVKGTQEEIEEYIKLENEYEEKMEERYEFQKKLSKIHNNEKKIREKNMATLISIICVDGVFILLGALSQDFMTILISLLLPPTALLVVNSVVKPLAYGTKKQRIKQKLEINNKIEKINERLKEIKVKLNKLDDKMECWDMVIDEKYDEIVPVTTVENTKANVKMRVLKLESNR